MPLDDVELVNRACAVIGADPIDALTADVPGAQIASRRYASLLEAMIGLPIAWPFALRTKQLSKVAATAPLSGWSCQFVLPPEMIGEIVKVSDDATMPDGHFDRFAREGNYLLADCDPIYARIKVLPLPSEMSGPFRIAFETGLAAALAMGLASDKDLHDRLWNEAFGPPSMSMLGGLCGAAAQAAKAATPTPGPFTAADPLTSTWRR